MFKNYVKIAFRNLLKNRIYSFINISGLAIGMAVTIMIGLWIMEEFNHNSYFKNKATVAQIWQSQTANDNTITHPAIPRPLEFELRDNYKDNFKHIIMSSWTTPSYLGNGEINIFREGNFMQEGAPAALDLKIIKGVKNGLKEINSIILSASTAKALFNEVNPIGKTVKMNNEDDMIVTGVYEDIPKNNSFNDLHYICPWSFYLNKQEWIRESKDSWGNNSFQMFVQINDNASMASVASIIKDVKKEKGGDHIKLQNPELILLPMKDWYLRANFVDGIQKDGRIDNVWLFGIIGVFVLLLACINFINLSTARSEKRAIEVGIRKSIGSKREQLIFQFLSESFIVVTCSFFLAIALVLLFLNGFNELSDKIITFPWSSIQFWMISLFFVIITTLISGSYPALYLSSFNPISVMKGTFKVGKYTTLPRKILVVIQFTFSIALITGTLIVLSQIQYSKDRAIGYKKEGLIQMPTMSPDFKGKSDIMRNQFKASGAILEMSTSSSPTTDIWSNRGGYNWEGKPDGLQVDFAHTSVSYEFIETIDIELSEGRGFSRKFPSDSSAVILNETAVKYMGIKNPIGKLIKHENFENLPEEELSPPLKIIGVIKDMVTMSPYNPVKQGMYVFQEEGNSNYYNLRLNPENSISENLTLIEKTFKTNFPNLPFKYEFVDQEYDKKFKVEQRIASLAKVFTLLAIFISCLGLFGLASFVAEQRTKEIGVRKILGASVGQLWKLLSKDFIILVLISLAIASPISYYLMNQWLQKFTYRTEVSISIFLIAGLGSIIITIITVSIQALRTVAANPADSLRSE